MYEELNPYDENRCPHCHHMHMQPICCPVQHCHMHCCPMHCMHFMFKQQTVGIGMGMGMGMGPGMGMGMGPGMGWQQ